MKISNWFGYPGMLEDESMNLVVDNLQRLADISDNMSKAVRRLDERVSAIEKILVTHNLARIPNE